MAQTGNPDSLGGTIAALRAQRGISLYELAKRTSIDRSVILRIESGHIRRPDPRKLARLAAALDADASQLYLLAGYAGDLPKFQPYLRTKYGHLPPDALRKLERYFDDIHDAYGITGGPEDGDDERPE